MPRRAASPANSGQLHLASGTPLSVGNSQANALTSATTRAANRRGRPGRGRSARPSIPCSQNRRRHLRTVSTLTPSEREIAAFAGTGGGVQHDPRPHHIPMLATGATGPRLQQSTLTITEHHHIRAPHRHRGVLAHDRWPAAPTHRADQRSWRACPHRRNQPNDHCATGWSPMRTTAGRSWPMSSSGTAAKSPTSAANSPTAPQPLCRLRYGGSAHSWGFAVYLASRDGYEDALLPTGYPVGTPGDALDCACGLYLNDPTAWAQPPTN